MKSTIGTLSISILSMLLGAALSSGCGGDASDGQAANTANSAIQSATPRENPATVAERYIGDACASIPGLPYYTHAGGATNDCADFVSAVLETAGYIEPGHITQDQRVNVNEFKGWLEDSSHGWKQVSKSAAQEGDVWLVDTSDYQHTTIVTTNGGGELIGCNGTSAESVSELPYSDFQPAPGETFFHKYTAWP